MIYDHHSFGFIIGELGRGGQENQLMILINQIKIMKQNCCLIVWTHNKDNLGFAEWIHSNNIEVLLLTDETILKKIKLSQSFLKENGAVTLQSFTYYLNIFTWAICLFTNLLPIGGVRSQLRYHRMSYGYVKFWINAILPKRKISNNHSFMASMDDFSIRLIFKDTMIVTNQIDMNKFISIKSIKENKNIYSASISSLYPVKSIEILIKAINELVLSGYKITHSHAGKGIMKNENNRGHRLFFINFHNDEWNSSLQFGRLVPNVPWILPSTCAESFHHK